jgi:hypothetical protein
MCRRGGCLFCGCFFFLNLFATYVLVDVVVLNFVHPTCCWSVPLLVVSLQNFVSGNQIFPIKKKILRPNEKTTSISIGGNEVAGAWR